MKESTEIVYKTKVGIGKILNLFLGLGFLVIAVIILSISDGYDFFSLLLFSVLFIAGIIPLGLFFNYLIFSIGRTISINTKTGKVNYQFNSQHKTLEINEIISVEIYEFKGIGLYDFDYSYAKYFFKNGEILIANDFMTINFFIPDGIKPNIIGQIVPLINQKNKEQEKSVSDYDELIDKYKNLSTKELEQIESSQSGYRKDAILAAKEILKKRKKAHNNV